MVSKDTTITVGCRIDSGGYRGTVRYIGPVDGYPGNWYGIEWDDPTRGKHNGSVNGIQYFTTKHPTAGSFVRREKLNFGKTLLEAITSKYGKKESEFERKLRQQEIQNLQKSIKAPFIEFVGFDKVHTRQSDFCSLEVVSVQSGLVSSIGDLGNLFPHLSQLDLSRNLLTSWLQVFDVCRQLDMLYWLNVSENQLEFPEEVLEDTFPKVTVLICGFMHLTWEDLKKLSEVFPNINELRANNNQITDLTVEEPNHFNNLEILDLEGNPIGSWKEIIKLRHIPSLQELSIDGIGLEVINFNTDTPKVDYFSNLTKLCLSNNNIKEWKSVGELNRLPNLEELRFINNPVLDTEDRDTATALVVARIGSLKNYNGRQLVGEFRAGDEFRRGCEYDYMKKYGLEWLQVKDTPHRDAFLREHNRYLDLIKLHGELEVGEVKVEGSNKLQDHLITLNLSHKDQTITKRVSPDMGVQKLRILVRRLFKLDGTPELVCCTEHGFEVPLDDDTKELGHFSVKNNDTIYVKSIVL